MSNKHNVLFLMFAMSLNLWSSRRGYYHLYPHFRVNEVEKLKAKTQERPNNLFKVTQLKRNFEDMNPDSRAGITFFNLSIKGDKQGMGRRNLKDIRAVNVVV